MASCGGCYVDSAKGICGGPETLRPGFSSVFAMTFTIQSIQFPTLAADPCLSRFLFRCSGNNMMSLASLGLTSSSTDLELDAPLPQLVLCAHETRTTLTIFEYGTIRQPRVVHCNLSVRTSVRTVPGFQHTPSRVQSAVGASWQFREPPCQESLLCVLPAANGGDEYLQDDLYAGGGFRSSPSTSSLNASFLL